MQIIGPPPSHSATVDVGGSFANSRVALGVRALPVRGNGERGVDNADARSRDFRSECSRKWYRYSAV